MARVSEWVLGIIGAIAAFMGGVILFGGAEQYIGVGGDLTWRVGDIEPGWGYGFIIGGGILLIVTVLTLMMEQRRPHEHMRQSELAGLISHIAVFVLVNGFLWLQDILAGGGLEYAYWVTIPWGVGLIAHVSAYVGSHGGHTTSPTPVG